MKSLTMALAAGTLAIGAAPAAAVELAPLAIAQPAPLPQPPLSAMTTIAAIAAARAPGL